MALHGNHYLTGITIRDEKGEEQRISLDWVFVEIGWLPNPDILDGFVQLNEAKEVAIDINCHTSRLGVFAAGDVTNENGKQIIIAAVDGAKAALEAFEYVMKTAKE